jgi:hypothetical protein
MCYYSICDNVHKLSIQFYILDITTIPGIFVLSKVPNFERQVLDVLDDDHTKLELFYRQQRVKISFYPGRVLTTHIIRILRCWRSLI